MRSCLFLCKYNAAEFLFALLFPPCKSGKTKLKEAKEFGYTLISESFDFFSDDDDDTEDYDDEEFLDVDEDELTNFLNEYYLVHPKRLPTSEFF